MIDDDILLKCVATGAAVNDENLGECANKTDKSL